MRIFQIRYWGQEQCEDNTFRYFNAITGSSQDTSHEQGLDARNAYEASVPPPRQGLLAKVFQVSVGSFPLKANSIYEILCGAQISWGSNNHMKHCATWRFTFWWYYLTRNLKHLEGILYFVHPEYSKHRECIEVSMPKGDGSMKNGRKEHWWHGAYYWRSRCLLCPSWPCSILPWCILYHSRLV